VTLSTFSSVFSPRRTDDKAKAGAHAYQGLPNWSEAIGGYIPKDEMDEEARKRKAKANQPLNHGGVGPDIDEGARGVAAGFGLGHNEGVGSALGYELGHDDLHAAGVLKWGKYGQKPNVRPLPVRRESAKPVKRTPSPRRKSVAGSREREVERRYRHAMAAKIQRAFRIIYLGADDPRGMFKGRAAAMQAAARRRVQLKRFARFFTAAVRVQRTFRAFSARRQAEAIVRGQAATTLQAAARRMVQQRMYAVALAEARRLAADKEAQARAAAERERLRKAASTIQLAYRRRHFRRVIALLKLQRSFRAQICRRLLKNLREATRLRRLTGGA